MNAPMTAKEVANVKLEIKCLELDAGLARFRHQKLVAAGEHLRASIQDDLAIELSRKALSLRVQLGATEQQP